MLKSANLLLVTFILTTIGTGFTIVPAIASTAPAHQGNTITEAGRLFEQGIEQFDQLQFEAAITSWQQSKKLYEDSRDPAHSVRVWECGDRIDKANTILNNVVKALDVFQKRLGQTNLSIELQKRARQGLLLGEVGRFYEEDEQDSEKAIESRLKSLAIAREIRNRDSEAIQLIGLSRAYQTLDNLEKNRWIGRLSDQGFAKKPTSTQHTTKALQYGEQGLTIAKELNDRKHALLALKILGQSYAELGNHQKAIDYQQQGLKLIRESQPQSIEVQIAEAEILNDLGLYHRANGNTAQSIQNHQASIAIYRNQDTQKSSYDYALDYALKDALINLGDAFQAHQDYANAVKAYQEFLEANRDGRIPYLAIRVWSQLGETFTKLNQLPEAESALWTALNQIESLRQPDRSPNAEPIDENDLGHLFVNELPTQAAQQLQQVLIRQNKIDAALEVAESSRARRLVDILSYRIDRRPHPSKSTVPQALKLQDIQQIAKIQNATLVNYSIVGADLIYIWVIKPTGEIQFRSSTITAEQSLSNLVSESRRDIGVRGRASIQAISIEDNKEPASLEQTHLRQLHQLLIEPIASELPKDPNQSVIFLPQGDLLLLPFAALPDAQGQPLIERHTLSIAPSVQTLELSQTIAKRPKAQENALIVGDPTMPLFQGSPLLPLPGARQEARAIGQLLKATPLLGEQATKAAVLEQISSAKILHFATHGLLDEIEGDMPGAIALAPNGNDTGLLSSSEIFNLQLNADLVVLSACDTGRGNITGDGVIGLSRSFIAAGAPSVVVSLWAVNDNTTSELMIEFYRQLNSQPSKAQALRQAILKVRARHSDPLHWAAFSLIGEPK